MPLIEIADLKVTVDQIKRTEFLADDSARVEVEIGGGLVERILSGEALRIYLDRVFELTGSGPSRS